MLNVFSKNPSRLHHAFELALNRKPTTEERETIEQLLTYAEADFKKNPKSATAIINVGQTKPENSDVIALASWTTVSRAILNLSETTTRN